MNEELIQKINSVSSEWNEIERRLKEAEIIIGEAVNPAVNELRYAGRMFVDAWGLLLVPESKEATKEFNDKIAVAKQYLQNARHDIIDAITLYHNKKVKELLQRHRKATLIQGYQDLESFLKKMDAANAIVTGSRADRAKRKQKYLQLENEYIPYLLAEYPKLDVAEKMAEARENRNRYIAIVGFIVGAVGLLGSLASILSYNNQCGFVTTEAQTTENEALICPKE